VEGGRKYISSHLCHPTPSLCTDHLHRVVRSSHLFIGSTSELVIMGHPPLPPPPQMSNGGSPPAHLPSSYLSDPSWWLQFKWSQPPSRAPEWLITYYERYKPPPSCKRRSTVDRRLPCEQRPLTMRLTSGKLLPFANAFASSSARALPRENGSGRLLPATRGPHGLRSPRHLRLSRIAVNTRL
jgi:hypothetical protein